MSPLEFVRKMSDIYFDEKEKCRRNSRRSWNFIFTLFFFLYLFQIFTAYIVWLDLAFYRLTDESAVLNIEEFRRLRLAALFFQGVVLGGIFLRFAAARFRGRWAMRVGEAGELIAFAALAGHLAWTIERRSYVFDGNGCFSSPLEGTHFYNGEIIVIFFLGWAIYKILLLSVAAWKTLRT